MKRFISVIATAALFFGLASCSGDLHDLETLDFSAGGVPGAMNGWNNTTVWTTADAASATYTYEFKAVDTSIQWKAIAVAGNWNSGAFGGASAEVSVPADGTEVKLAYDNATGGGKNCVSEGLEKNATYKITLKIEGADATAKLEKIGGASAISSYYLDGMYLVGAVFNVDGISSNTWSFSSANLIWGATTDSQTGIVTYTKDVKATATKGEMGINDSTWNNKQLGVGVTIAAGAEEAVALNGTVGNFNVTGLTVGKPYRVEISTTPEKVISIKIYEIAEITLSFKVKGLNEGDSAWINGSIWGDGWPQGWPIVAWNSNDAEKTAGFISAHPAAVADSSGVATFGAKWNKTFISKIGDTKSWECKVVYIADGASWDGADSVKDSGDNLKFDYKVTAGGSYTFVIDAADGWKISVK